MTKHHSTPKVKHSTPALYDTIQGLNSLVQQLCQTQLSSEQRQCTDKILLSIAALENLIPTSSIRGASASVSASTGSHVPVAHPDHEDAFASTSPAEATSEHAEIASSPQILLVEDDEINQAIMFELLKVANVHVDIANNGQEAVDAVNRSSYQLIFMDVKMPGMDGYEATRRIRAAGYTMPIVAMSGNTDKEEALMGYAAGMTDYLTKPVVPEKIFQALNQWITAPAATATTNTAAQSGTQAESILPDAIEGFNIAAGLAAVGNNKELYADLLAKFAQRYATIAEDIASCIHVNDIETALRLAHTVKGIAANLGAEKLAESAAELEKIIAHEPQKITVHLEKLMLRLDAAIVAVRGALQKNASDEEAQECVAVNQLLSIQQIKNIYSLLGATVPNMETDWNKAAEATQKAYRMLIGSHLEHPALLLKKAVEDFAAQKAQSLCQVLRTALLEIQGTYS